METNYTGKTVKEAKKLSLKKLNNYIKTYAQNCRYSFNRML